MSAGAVLVGPVEVGAVVLAAGGLLKAWRPTSAARAMAALGLPGATSLTVRGVGAGEAALGGLTLAVGGRWAAVLVAASYMAFALVVGLALRRRLPLSSCGCLGLVDTPPSWAHVALDLALALASGAAAVAGPLPALPAVLGAQPLGGLPFVMLVMVSAYLAMVAMTVLPQVRAVARPTRAGTGPAVGLGPPRLRRRLGLGPQPGQ